jgi:sugar phosphate isomerase/epimerase
MINHISLISRISIAFLLFASGSLAAQDKAGKAQMFARKNLSAWCIVPYDDKKRGPEERALMLKSLGINKFAYDWREEHVPLFDQEMAALKKHDIELEAFWMPYGPDPVKAKHYREIMDVLARHNVKTQLWWSYGSSDENLKGLSDDEKIIAVGRMVQALADDAAKIGCTVGLYNHNGWFGEPENELAVLQYVNRPNVGIVYNFNHAEGHWQRFREFFPKLLPHLLALNIAGITSVPPSKIVAVGSGGAEAEMIRIVAESGYNGTIGIINEDTDPDAERGLRLNIGGLKSILSSLGYTVEL